MFVLDSTGQPLVGNVWPGNTVFPDWFNPATAAWWKQQITAFHSQVVYLVCGNVYVV